jgi:hypothetical protein
LPDYEGWRCSHTNGIHMLLRIAHGQWRLCRWQSHEPKCIRGSCARISAPG